TVEINKKEVSIGENTARLIKLQQVLSGWLKDEYGKIHRIPGPNPRLEALMEEVDLCQGKLIIWCMFREDIKIVAERLRLEKIGFVEYHGGIKNKEERQRSVDKFREKKKIRVFLGQPGAGGEGLPLDVAE